MTDAANADLPDEARQSDVPSAPVRRRRVRRLDLASWSRAKLLGLYAGVVFVAGVISGWVWHAIVKVPSYLTSDDGSVQMTERAVGQIFSIDAIFVIIGLLAGLALGLVAWTLFRRAGWLVAVIATLGGLLAGVLCWLVGVLQGPRDFAERVAAANSGDRIPIDFQLHTVSALLVWALGAIIPVMLYANLSHEDDDSDEFAAFEESERSELGSGASDLGEGEIEYPGKITGSQLD